MTVAQPGNANGPGGRYLTPLRTVFPWWFLGGAATSVVLIYLVIDSKGAPTGALLSGWVFITVGVVSQRRDDAARRHENGLTVGRRSLSGPPGYEPTITVLFVGMYAGIALLLSSLFRSVGLAVAWPQSLAAVLLVAATGTPLVLLTRWWGRSRQLSYEGDHS